MKLKTIYLLVFGLLSFSGILAQTVTGTVTDSSGNPVPGVNVIEKGTSNGTSTDFDGNYSIDVSGSNAILEYSALGFVTVERSASSGSVINVSMEESTEELNAVVVTALGIKKEQKALGYSLTEVSGEAVAEVPQVNAINALQGKIAGVNITGAATGPAG
ncbi:MAG: SusC/RagA family TonB-linked outer membrane protein, partial [Leeuwenhoekiella sp.]